MKKNNLFLLVIPVLFFASSELSACTCGCVPPHADYDSLLNIHCKLKGTQPDSILENFISEHEKIFFGTIKSVIITGLHQDTETVQVTIDTVIKGQINRSVLTLKNIPYRGDCVSSAKSLEGFSFMGYIDPKKEPVHLRELGFYTACGLVGYLYRSSSLIRLGIGQIGTKEEHTVMEQCTTKVFLFDTGKLSRTAVKEKIKFGNPYVNGSAPQFYSIRGEKLSSLRSNSVIIVYSNKCNNTFFKLLELKH